MSNPITASIGWSNQADSFQTGKEAAESALKRLSPLKPKLAIVLSSSRFHQAALLHGVR